MPKINAFQILESIFSNEEMDQQTFDKIRSMDEGLHLEFKSGKISEKEPNNCAKIVCEYVSGFASSDGGILVIGLPDKKPENGTRKIEPFKAFGKSSMHDWASRVL